jgi:hypothetical protein
MEGIRKLENIKLVKEGTGIKIGLASSSSSSASSLHEAWFRGPKFSRSSSIKKSTHIET